VRGKRDSFWNVGGRRAGDLDRRLLSGIINSKPLELESEQMGTVSEDCQDEPGEEVRRSCFILTVVPSIAQQLSRDHFGSKDSVEIFKLAFTEFPFWECEKLRVGGGVTAGIICVAVGQSLVLSCNAPRQQSSP